LQQQERAEFHGLSPSMMVRKIGQAVAPA